MNYIILAGDLDDVHIQSRERCLCAILQKVKDLFEMGYNKLVIAEEYNLGSKDYKRVEFLIVTNPNKQ